MDKPKILYISFGLPQPNTGLGVRADIFLRSMSRIGDVSFVFRAPPDMDGKDLDYLRSLCSEIVPFAHESFLWRSPLTRLIESKNRYLKILPLLFARKPIYIHTNWLAKNKSVLLDKFLDGLDPQGYDIIHVNRLYMADSVSEFIWRCKGQGVPTTLDLDDIESLSLERYLAFSSLRPRTAPGRMLRRMDLHRLRKYERRVLPRFNACIVCSEVDKKRILRQRLSDHPWVVENAVDTTYFRPGNDQGQPASDIVFVGNMGYEPNIDAVRYFAREILPIIRSQVPACRFIIVGKEPGEIVNAQADGHTVLVTGAVEDVRPYYECAAVSVAPIRFGGGTRIKILEAMAMGKAVVSTTIGIEGIPAANGREAVIADDPGGFAKACIELLRDVERANELGRNARSFVCRRFDRPIIEHKIQSYFESILRDRTSEKTAWLEKTA